MENQKYKPKLSERAKALFVPKRKADETPKADEMPKNPSSKPRRSGGVRMAATGYGNHGASNTLNSMLGWNYGGGSAEDDVDLQGDVLRKRSRDLFAAGGIARSGPVTLQTSVVAWGIKPKPKLDTEMLGMTEEAAEEWERNTLREFNLWADNVFCDAERQQNFYGLQQLAFLSMLVSGDVFAVFGMKENKRTPYQTTVRLLEADRISTPDTNGTSESKATDSGNGRIVDGVEIDKEGAVVRYWVANRHPLSGEDETELAWNPIDAFGADTGYPNILHVMTYERPEQRRGVPFIASEIEQIKQLDRYMNAELAANIVAAMLACFITSKADDGMSAFQDVVNDEDKVTNDEINFEMRPGMVVELPPGKEIQQFSPLRPNSAYQSYVDSVITMAASGSNIPKEVLLKKYESNYTAARAALLDFWRTVRVYRTRFNNDFNQPIYEMWLSEAVAAGRIDAPGFFDDPVVRQAWCGCLWMGASMGHVDPLKEINAAAMRIQNNVSTQEQEASEYNGNDWNANVRQRKKELSSMAELQKLYQELSGSLTDDEEGDDEDAT